VVPVYDVRPTGPKHRQRFLCELRVPGFDYVAAGNSTVKKDAQSNAARDFVAFLVRQGLMQARFVLLLLRLFIPGSQFPVVLWIRIRIGSRFSGVPGFGSGFEVRIQKGENNP
jgi:hypothetical protein